MSEGEMDDPVEDPYLEQVSEKIKMVQWNLDMMADLDDRLEQHFNKRNL